jgi:8-hydroxy-5-deazaflavin:NADPH oxidoreductase
MKKKIGILGSGIVGKVLGSGFIANGHEVMIGTRNAAKLSEWQASSGGKTGSFEEAAAFGEILVLTVKGSVASEVLRTATEKNLAGKTIIDTTNPIADLPPQNGVLQYFTEINRSLMERLQDEFATAHFVKAYNSVGNAFMVNPDFGGVKPTMFICGNNDEAKKEVTVINTLFGWETADMGKAEGARAIEPLCMLWCIPGMLGGGWNYAFKLLRK